MKPKVLNEPYEAILECPVCGDEYTAVIDGSKHSPKTCGKDDCLLAHTNKVYATMKMQRDALLEIVQSFAEVAPGNDYYDLSNGMNAGQIRAKLKEILQWTQ